MSIILTNNGLPRKLDFLDERDPRDDAPVTMFLYQVITWASSTSGRGRLSSSSTPEEFITRYVGIGGRLEGTKKSIVDTIGLLTAPAKRGLMEQEAVSQHILLV